MTFSLLPLYFSLGVAAYFLFAYFSRPAVKPKGGRATPREAVSDSGGSETSALGASSSGQPNSDSKPTGQQAPSVTGAATAEEEENPTSLTSMNLSLHKIVFLLAATAFVSISVVYAIELLTGTAWQYIYAIPAFVIGATAGTFFDPGAQGSRGPIKATFVAFSTILLTLVALDHEYSLFRNLSKLNAGVLSLEFAQVGNSIGAGSHREGGVSSSGGLGSSGSSDVSVPAFARTSGISYVTKQFNGLSLFIDEDDKLAEIVSGASSNDPQNYALKHYVCKRFSRLAYYLDKLQDKYNSEVPTLAGIHNVSKNLRRLYEISLRFELPKELAAESGQDKITEAMLNISRYDNPLIIESKQTQDLRNEFIKIDQSITDSSDDVELEIDFGAINTKPPNNPNCENTNYASDSLYETFRRIVRLGDGIPESSSFYGYFAIITAFAEYVDGNSRNCDPFAR
jgi:hypothetical protein